MRCRFIPAPAGNRIPPGWSSSLKTVHPRACGEQSAPRAAGCGEFGSSPRLRGTVEGLRHDTVGYRFIPAPAGNSRPLSCRMRPFTVHPRACGEQFLVRYRRRPGFGSSPRLRGTVGTQRYNSQMKRFIPAPAGNRPSSPPTPVPESVHPRACGEQQIGQAVYLRELGSSPRLRGTEPPGGAQARGRRFIPAPAGNSHPPRNSAWLTSVHPRACGEQEASGA